MHYLAEAGVKRAMLAVENDDTDIYDALSDNWSDDDEAFKDVMLGAGTFSIVRQLEGESKEYGLVDEERKININKVPREVLSTLLEITAELSSDEAGAVADAIVDWRDEDDEPGDEGAEDWYYSSLDSPYDCKNGDFETVEELTMVKGVTREIFDSIRESVTVYGDGAVNVNTAGETALRALGMDEELAGKFITFRQTEEGIDDEAENVFSSAENVASALNSAAGLSSSEISRINKIFGLGLLTVVSDNFMGHSIGRVAGRDEFIFITFVYNRKDKELKYWRES